MMINYAHRGASSYYPENTLSAFYAGVFMGADGIETDVQRTKDGVLVLFHDDTLDRITDGTGRLCDHTYAQLQALTVKNPAGDRFDKIVTLEDFLRYFGWRQLTFAVELKQPGVERETIDVLEAFGMAEKTILTSFHFDSIRAAKEYAPHYRVGYLYDRQETNAEEKLRSIGGEQLCPRANMMTPEKVAAWKAEGFSVRAWGVSDTDVMAHVVRCGGDGMTVNFPDQLALFLKNT